MTSRSKNYIDINHFLNSDYTSLKLLHPDLQRIDAGLGVCFIDIVKDIEIKSFEIRLPIICNYLDIETVLSLRNGKMVLEKNDSDYFLKDERAENSLLVNKHHKFGLSFIFKNMSIDEKTVMADILKNYLNKETLTVGDWMSVDEDIFQCFLLSSNRLGNFIDAIPNLHKFSKEMKIMKENFVFQDNGSIHITNFKSVLENFVDNYYDTSLLN